MTGVTPTRQSDEQHPNGPAALSEADLPPTTRNQPHPNQGRELREKIKFWMEVAAFALLVFGAILGYRTLDELSQQTTAITQQTYSGQRAYLLVENLRLHRDDRVCVSQTSLSEFNVHLIPPTPENPRGTPMWVQWDIKNTGQTPAHNIQVFGDFRFDTVSPPLDIEIPPAMLRPIGGALGPNECQPSVDAPFMWLGRAGNRYWTQEDAIRISGTPPKERLWAVVYVVYDTIFKGIRGYSSVCGYYEGARFTACGTVMK